jgi:hypothetical protein
VPKEKKEKVPKEKKEKVPKEKKEKVPKEKKEKVPKEKKEPPLVNEITTNNNPHDEIELDVSTIIFDDKQYLMDNDNNIYDYNTNEKIGFYKDYTITFI